MKAKEILRHINGFSTPIGGIQWQVGPAASKVAKNFMNYLEDCRVLYEQDMSAEVEAACIAKVEEIRQESTQVLNDLDEPTEVSKSIRKLREQCRKFCREIGHPTFMGLADPVRKSILENELISLRRVAGKTVGDLSVSFNLDVEDELATIIPFKNRA